MRKRIFKKAVSVMLTAGMLAAAVFTQPVLADSERVVTLGADLSKEDQKLILKYFGVKASEAHVIYVTNDEERAFLSDYIPLSVIGSHTLSCAYVKPTSKGGIQVKTANLTWVTSNMIASALSTAGVKNCEVIAACPRPVSGTGALTGVLKAYETAASSVLDDSRKVIAAQEIATYSDIAENIGQAEATDIINQIKIQVIEEGVDETDYELIQEIVDDAVDDVLSEIEFSRDELLDLTEEQRAELADLAEKIAEQKYQYEDVKETLERVEKNVSSTEVGSPDVNVNVNISNDISNDNKGQTVNQDVDTSADNAGQTVNQDADATVSEDDADEEGELEEDSIFKDTDDGLFGEGAVIDATTQEAMNTDKEPAGEEEKKEDGDENLLFDIETSDNTVVPDDSAAPEGEEEEKAGDAVEPGDGRTDDETDETDDWMKELFGEETSDDETGDEETKEPGQTESEEQQTESEAQQTEGEDDGEEKDDNWFFDIFEQDETDTASQPTGEENDEWDPGIDETGHDEEGDMENPMAADESGEEIDTERTVDADEPDDLDEADDTANDGSEDLKEDEKEEDGDLFDENEENEDGTDGSAGSAPEISFDSDFDSYAVQLTVEGNKVPVSGKLVIESEGETVKKTDLSDTSAWGALKSDFGDETVIYVFTGKALPAGSYRISLKDAVFAEADADGLPVPGTETSPVKVTEDVTYEASGLTVSGDSFTAFSEAELNVSVPEGTAYVELSSSDEDVLIVGEYDPESETAVLSFEGSGTAVVTAEYYSEDGELLGEDTLEIAVF